MDEAGRNRLWEKYIASHDSEIREQLIVEYAQLVKLVAGRMNMYLGYNVEYDDLVGYGVFGLIDAIDKFDSVKNVKFETYASLRTLESNPFYESDRESHLLSLNWHMSQT